MIGPNLAFGCLPIRSRAGVAQVASFALPDFLNDNGMIGKAMLILGNGVPDGLD